MNFTGTQYLVLKILYTATEQVCGSDIRRLTKIKSGTLYPILKRFLNAKLIRERRERGNPRKLGRPLKVFYRLTVKGKEQFEAWEKTLNTL